jgi:hypothetical protein
MSAFRVEIFGEPTDLEMLERMLPEENASKFPIQTGEKDNVRGSIWRTVTSELYKGLMLYLSRNKKYITGEAGGQVLLRAGDPESKFHVELKAHAKIRISDDE